MSTSILALTAFGGAVMCIAAHAEPLSQETDVFLSGEDDIVEYRIPAVVTTNEGTLVAVCDARVDRSGDAPNNIDLVLKRSTDYGATWSESVVLDRFGGAYPSMVELSAGSILCVYY